MGRHVKPGNVRALHGLALMGVLLVGCAGTTDLPPGSTASLEVMPGAAAVPVGGSVKLESIVRNQDGIPVPNAQVTWRTANPTAAIVNASGLVSGQAVGEAWIFASSGFLEDSALVTVYGEVTGPAITINPAVTYQVITGWEGVAQIGELACNPVAVENYRGPLMDRVVNELGLNRVRLEVPSGRENPNDYFADLLAGVITLPQYRMTAYTIINDNADPNVIEPSGFQFGAIDYIVEYIVLPMRQRLAARGESLYVNLNYVDFGSSTFEHYNSPAEYAELILATFLHMQSRWGFVPDGVEIILEPDNVAAWTPARIGAMIVATSNRLRAAGFEPDFIAPSTTNATTSLTYLNGVLAVPGVADVLTEFSYHRYSGVSAGVLMNIGNTAAQRGLRTSMLEHIGSGHEDLHQDLKLARVSSWQQYTIAFCTQDNGAQYYRIDDSNPSNPQVILGSRTRFLTQYFRDVRAGALRVDATSTLAALDPLAFVNQGGGTVVVVKAAAGASFHVVGLPGGTYGIRYTTDAEFAHDLADVTIPAGAPLAASIPARGVVTVYRK
jgi:hypothetical protein